MGIAEVLTIIFVIAKLIGVIDWSWWIVLAPEIANLIITIVMFVFFKREFFR